MEHSTCEYCGMPIWGVPQMYVGMSWTHEHNDSKYCDDTQAKPVKESV